MHPPPAVSPPAACRPVWWFRPGAAYPLVAALFGLAYFGAALLGHALSLRPSAVATFWPASGLYLAALLSAPPRRWAGLVAAAAAATVASDVFVMGKPFAFAPVFVAANAAEALAGAALVRLLAGTGAIEPGRRMRDTLAVGAAALAGPLAGAALGAGAVAALAGASLAAVWPVWWASDALGVLVAAPPALAVARAWTARGSSVAPTPRRPEAAALFAATLACTAAVSWLPAAAPRPAFLALPPLLWAALRLGPSATAAAAALFALVATAGTAAGFGPFAARGWTTAEQAVVLQLFLCVGAATAQLLAAAAAEREATAARLTAANARLEATAAALTAHEAELRARNERLRTLADAAAGLVAAEEPDAVLAPLFGAGAVRLGVEVCTCHVLDGGDERASLRLTASAGLPEATRAELGRLPLDGPLPCSRVAATGRPLVAEAIQDSGDPAMAAVRDMGLRAYAGYPVFAPDGRVLGVLSFAGRVRDRFAPEELEFFQALAHLLAGAWGRAAAAAALRDGEAFLRSVLDAGTDCVKVVGLDGRLESMNAGGLCLMEIDDFAALEGREWAALWPEEARARVREAVTAARAGRADRFEAFCPTAKGAPRWWDVAVAPVRDGAGRVTRLVSASRDATERKRAEAASRRSEARLQELLGTLDLASVLVRDLDGTIRFWSDGCRRLYGWTAAEAVGRDAHELFGAGFSAPLPGVEAALLREGEWGGDAVHRRRDGTEVTVAVREMLRRDARGRPVAVVANAADVTALRRAQADLERLNADLEGRVREEVAAREAAQERLAHAQRMEALGQLAGGIAHDFNNVLQAVLGAAALIERRPADAAGSRRLARLALDAAGRGVSITGRLLAFSRRDVLRAEPVDAASLLAGTREMLAHTLGAGIEVRADAARGLPPLLADKGQLETVLVNLATNARDAMGGGGTLTLAASAETLAGEGAPDRPRGLGAGSYVRLTVADTGSGMDAATLARVTEPFFTTKPVGQGTGLGLSMAAGFAEQSGGALCIQSAPGRGTTVSLWFPLAAGARPDVPPPDGWAGPAAVGAGGRVLLVDDDAVVREVMAEQLEEAGHVVLLAGGGAEVLALLDAGEGVDLIVSDLSMPGMDGAAVIGEARRRRPGLPAVLLTGFADAELAIDGATSGAFTLLCKPVTGRQLAERVAALLRGAAPVGDADRTDRAGAVAPRP